MYRVLFYASGMIRAATPRMEFHQAAAYQAHMWRVGNDCELVADSPALTDRLQRLAALYPLTMLFVPGHARQVAASNRPLFSEDDCHGKH